MESYKTIRGQCYSIKLHVNHPCQFDIQCPQHSDCLANSASAGPDKVCKCRQGFSPYRGKCQKEDDFFHD
uniref:EB domain-containing protein n=1 Tax=Romanomermis culicivorax TaxID=13658 RepID=A0A915JTZ9_ROMCU